MLNKRQYVLENIIQRLDPKVYVLTGDSAFVYCGLSVSGIYHPDLLTVNPAFTQQLRLPGYCTYCPVPVLDTEHYVTTMKDAPLVLVPTPERAIVENIKYNLDFIDEGYFCDAVCRYQEGSAFNYNLLMEVADFFQVPRDKVDYWLQETEGFNSY